MEFNCNNYSGQVTLSSVEAIILLKLTNVKLKPFYETKRGHI